MFILFDAGLFMTSMLHVTMQIGLYHHLQFEGAGRSWVSTFRSHLVSTPSAALGYPLQLGSGLSLSRVSPNSPSYQWQLAPPWGLQVNPPIRPIGPSNLLLPETGGSIISVDLSAFLQSPEHIFPSGVDPCSLHTPGDLWSPAWLGITLS